MLSSNTVRVCPSHATVQGRLSVVSIRVQQEGGPAAARIFALMLCDPQEVLVVNTPAVWKRRRQGVGEAGPERHP